MSEHYLRILCFALLIAFGTIDAVSPWAFTASILSAIPVVLSAFAGSPRFTWWLVLAAIITVVIGGYAGSQDPDYNRLIDLADRALVILVIVAVGLLSVRLQEAMYRSNQLAIRHREWAERESALRRAVEVMRASLDAEQVDRAIVREATAALDTDVALLFSGRSGLPPTTFRFERGAADVQVSTRRLSPEVAALVAKAVKQTTPVALRRGDESATSVVDALGVDQVLAAPLGDGNASRGVLVVARKHSEAPFDPESLGSMWAFVAQASLSIARATLFTELVKRNERLANTNRELETRLRT